MLTEDIKSWKINSITVSNVNINLLLLKSVQGIVLAESFLFLTDIFQQKNLWCPFCTDGSVAVLSLCGDWGLDFGPGKTIAPMQSVIDDMLLQSWVR